MAATSQRGSSNRASSRGRSASSGSSGSSRGRSSAGAKPRSSASKAASARRSSASAAKEKRSNAAKSASSNGGIGDQSSARDTITQVAIPAVTGAIGIAGGVLLGRTTVKRNRKVLGIPMPGVKIDLADVAKQIGEASRQFGRLANEVKVAREKAEKIGRAAT
jgi:hypothetical protein